MPSCNVCTHPEREAIDRALVEGANDRAVARRYGLSRDAVWRHRSTHLPLALQRAHEAREGVRALDLHGRLEAHLEDCTRAVTAATKAKDRAALNGALGQRRAALALAFRLTGELGDSKPTTTTAVQVNIGGLSRDQIRQLRASVLGFEDVEDHVLPPASPPLEVEATSEDDEDDEEDLPRKH